MGRRHGPATGTEDYMEAIVNLQIVTGYTEVQLAQATGLDRGAIGRIRRGNAAPYEMYKLLAFAESLASKGDK